eukprot:gene9572-1775_t
MSETFNSLIDKLKEFYDSQTNLQLVEHAICGIAAYKLACKILTTNWKNQILSAVNTLPMTEKLLEDELDRQAKQQVIEMIEKKKKSSDEIVYNKLPEHGLEKEKIMELLKAMKKDDINPKDGKSWAYVYSTENKEHHEMVNEAHSLFLETNALNPMAFNSLRKMENEIVKMSIDMMHGDKDTVGSVTTGGTESILCAIKTYRDRARKLTPHIKNPEMIVCRSVHPAFIKASSYFDVKAVFVDMDKDMRFDVEEFKTKLSSNTILVVCSAPQYAHGVVDPVEKVSEITKKLNLPLHVDSCIGGFVLPFAEQLGYKIPTFDFRIDGVTSISMDAHKYGYSSKGVSVILYKNKDIRKYQFFSYSQWCGGLFVSPSMPGTRGGGPIASAYASMLGLGLEGFKQQTKFIMETCDYIKSEVNKMEDLKIIGNPESSLLSFESTNSKINIFSVGDVLEESGWKMECQRLPDSIHCTVFPLHAKTRESFISALKQAVKTVKENPEKYKKEGITAMYGMTNS